MVFQYTVISMVSVEKCCGRGLMVLCKTKRTNETKYLFHFVSQSTNFQGPMSTLQNISFHFVSQKSINFRARLVFCEMMSFHKVPTLGAPLVLCEITGFNTTDFNCLNKTILTCAVVHCLVLA